MCVKNRFLLMLSLLLVKELNHANQIHLKNGDLLHGKLVNRNESGIVWHSDTFGLITIPVENLLESLDEKPFQKPALAQSTDRSEKSPPFYEGSVSLTGSASSGNQERKN